MGTLLTLPEVASRRKSKSRMVKVGKFLISLNKDCQIDLMHLIAGSAAFDFCPFEGVINWASNNSNNRKDSLVSSGLPYLSDDLRTTLWRTW